MCSLTWSSRVNLFQPIYLIGMDIFPFILVHSCSFSFIFVHFRSFSFILVPFSSFSIIRFKPGLRLTYSFFFPSPSNVAVDEILVHLLASIVPLPTYDWEFFLAWKWYPGRWLKLVLLDIWLMLFKKQMCSFLEFDQVQNNRHKAAFRLFTLKWRNSAIYEHWEPKYSMTQLQIWSKFDSIQSLIWIQSGIICTIQSFKAGRSRDYVGFT